MKRLSSSYKIFAFIFLLFVAFLGLGFFPKAPQAKKIAVLTKLDFQGENSFACRLQAACKNLGWESDIIDITDFKYLKKHPYDFVINLVPGRYKFRGAKYYLAIFHPIHHYFEPDGTLSKTYRSYDGYLLTYSPERNDKNFGLEKTPYLKWYPTTQMREYQEPNPTALFYLACVWGNRFDDIKMQRFLNLLDKKSFTRVYGRDLIKKLCPQAYRSPLPYDSHSVCEAAHLAGVTLVLHSEDHNAHGLPSGRIFEAAAASTVIISDKNAFVKEYFGDSVLYIDTEQSAENIIAQVEKHMDWIQSHREAAVEKARQAYAIYRDQFLLEEQMSQLIAFHEEISQNVLLKWIEKTSSYLASFFKEVSLLWSTPSLAASPLLNPAPWTVLPNPNSQYSLLNSVDFHPQSNIFCATYTHNNKISLYEIGADHQPRHIQTLSNPTAQLSEPQHAVFSPNGDRIVATNWTNQTLNVYSRKGDLLFSETPLSIVSTRNRLRLFKPHGIAFSPCGKYLAAAYGASINFRKGIALFRSRNKSLQCISVLSQNLPGTPKGIVFTPDGTHLLVSFCEPNRLALFSISNGKIDPTPKQIIAEEAAQLSRPEDVKISPNGSYCAVSNSDQNTVTFYYFDKRTNTISNPTPFYCLQNPEAKLTFPHGIAFSADGNYLAVTQFGHVQIDAAGDIFWDTTLPSQEGAINLYLLNPQF